MHRCPPSRNIRWTTPELPERYAPRRSVVCEVLIDLCVVGNISHLTAIERLPEKILMEIFKFDRLASTSLSQGRPDLPWEWHRLVHVCQRWRYVILKSPHSLDLQLFCTYGTPVKDDLDCWPALPIVMQYSQLSSTNPLPISAKDEDSIIAAFQYPHRICTIELAVTTALFEILTTVEQGPFLALERLELMTQAETGYILLLESFGRYFPRLRVLKLTRIGFIPPQMLLLSTTNLVSLHLEDLPSSGYVSPEVLLTFFPIMTRLERLHLYFLPPIARPMIGNSYRAPQRRVVLPSLEDFGFRGVCEDLECLLSRTGAPVLKDFDVTFFNQATIFDTTQLRQFLSPTETQGWHYEARLFCSETDISITLT